MTRTPEIEKLLSELPDEALPHVTHFLKALLNRSTKNRPSARGKRRSSHAARSFGMIPADPAIVRRVLAEDLYDLG
jgi:hypothetical protein